MTTFKHSCFDY